MKRKTFILTGLALLTTLSLSEVAFAGRPVPPELSSVTIYGPSAGDISGNQEIAGEFTFVGKPYAWIAIASAPGQAIYSSNLPVKFTRAELVSGTCARSDWFFFNGSNVTHATVYLYDRKGTVVDQFTVYRTDPENWLPY